MMFNTFFLLVVLPVFTFALPTPHGSHLRRNHKLIRLSKRESSSKGLFNTLFPAGLGLSSWTTAKSVVGGVVDGADGLNAVKLSNEAFNPTNMLDRALPTYGTAPDGSEAMVVHFSKGAYDYKGPEGGVSFYGKPIDLSNTTRATFAYSIYFPDGFDFNRGGKLPGLYGGDNAETSISCSGGRRDPSCWSLRFMWREEGKGELYAYMAQPDEPQFSGNKQLCDVEPYSVCNSQYGASVGRGAWTFETGRWTAISQYIELNDVGRQNGRIQVTVDGKTVIDQAGLAFRTKEEGSIQGVQFQSFFGGHTPEWASPKDQKLYFSNFAVSADPPSI